MNGPSSAPVVKDLVLVGGGHSHVEVLRRFAMKPVPGVRVTLICRDVHTPYSGMLPGYVAGHYDFDDAHIDLGALCRYAGARCFHATATGLDLAARRVICEGRPPVPYDVLSINTGSTPDTSDIGDASGNVTPVKPINRFLRSWDEMARRAIRHPGRFRIVVVGGGAGGIELLLAVRHRLRSSFRENGRAADGLAFELVSGSAEILPGHNAAMRRIFEKVLSRRDVTVHAGERAVQAGPGVVRTDGGRTIAADEVLWVTAAAAPDWPREAGLDVDEDGFIAVADTLESTSHPGVFAAGDVAAVLAHPRPKSGVFAVRQGPPLAENLRRALLGRKLRSFRPQKKFLSIVSTGERSAVAGRGRWAVRGRLVWRWKDWIDRRFMRKYSDFPEMAAPTAPALPGGLAGEEVLREIASSAMRCGGCGAKVGSGILGRALETIYPVARDDIVVGLDAPDDAAIVEIPEGKLLVQTLDSFRAMVEDPYVFGKIAANHCLGDIYAMGGEPQTALAVATLPYGIDEKVEDTLHQLMAGATEILNEAGCALVGGHTGEGAELSLGFAVNGLIGRNVALRKAGLRPGDSLVLTKPIGTGVLLAADMRHRARSRWIAAAVDRMLLSNKCAAECLKEHGARAATDVTGFGLLGHLKEMTDASGVSAEIDLREVPVLEGAEATVRAGIFSSLQPQNVKLRHAVSVPEDVAAAPRYALLFDPQTAGGLLAGVPPERATACVAALRRAGYPEAGIIGTVQPAEADTAPIKVVNPPERPGGD